MRNPTLHEGPLLHSRSAPTVRCERKARASLPLGCKGTQGNDLRESPRQNVPRCGRPTRQPSTYSLLGGSRWRAGVWVVRNAEHFVEGFLEDRCLVSLYTRVAEKRVLSVHIAQWEQILSAAVGLHAALDFASPLLFH